MACLLPLCGLVLYGYCAPLVPVALICIYFPCMHYVWVYLFGEANSLAEVFLWVRCFLRSSLWPAFLSHASKEHWCFAFWRSLTIFETVISWYCNVISIIILVHELLSLNESVDYMHILSILNLKGYCYAVFFSKSVISWWRIKRWSYFHQAKYPRIKISQGLLFWSNVIQYIINSGYWCIEVKKF